MNNLTSIFVFFTLLNGGHCWSPNHYPFLPASTDTSNVREMIIAAQGENKRILDIGCGFGYSTSSSEGSLGIDTREYHIKKAKQLFPNKNFRRSFFNAKNFDEDYDVVTLMFHLNNVPQYIRRTLIESAIKIAKERVVIVDIDPDYKPEPELLNKRMYIPDYMKNCRDDLSLFQENVLVTGLLKLWIYNKTNRQEEIYEKYNEHKLHAPCNNEDITNSCYEEFMYE